MSKYQPRRFYGVGLIVNWLQPACLRGFFVRYIVANDIKKKAILHFSWILDNRRRPPFPRGVFY